MAQYNGGWTTYPDRTREKIFFRACDRNTKTLTVLSGQVLKARSFVETNAAGKAIAHSGVTEKALVTFPAKVDTGETVIIAGLTFTAGTNATTTTAQLIAAWENLPVGTTAAQANALKPTACTAAIGTFTAGTLTGYSSKSSSTAGSVLFVSETPFTNVADLTVTGTGDASSVSITAFGSSTIAGVTMYDVDASGGDVDAEVYCEASFWADALVWKANIATDTITLFDGTTKACTEYDTGCNSDAIKKKFVEGSEFCELGFLSAGEVL